MRGIIGRGYTNVTTYWIGVAACASARPPALHQRLAPPRPAHRLRRARRLGQDDAAEAVQNVAEIRRLRRRHDQMEFIGADQTDYQEPEGGSRAQPGGILAPARRRLPSPRRADDSARVVGR